MPTLFLCIGHARHVRRTTPDQRESTTKTPRQEGADSRYHSNFLTTMIPRVAQSLNGGTPFHVLEKARRQPPRDDTGTTQDHRDHGLLAVLTLPQEPVATTSSGMLPRAVTRLLLNREQRNPLAWHHAADASKEFPLLPIPFLTQMTLTQILPAPFETHEPTPARDLHASLTGRVSIFR